METPNAGTRGPLDVVIVYAFDCTTTTPAWSKMEEVYSLVHEKLTHFAGSSLGYIYVMSTPNTYTCDMKLVDPGETAATGYKKSFVWRRTACMKNMASGLKEAHKLVRDRESMNGGVILFFSDGSVTKGDYFDATETFFSILPVHTFTLAGDAHNEGLRTVAANSPGGTFNRLPVPDKPKQSAPFSQLLDSILLRSIIKNDGISGKLPKNVFIVYAFDSTTSTPAYKKVDEIFWMVHKKLTKFVDSSLGYIYVMSTPNTYTFDIKLVDPTDKDGSYKCGPVWRRTACTKNMASGLDLANKLIKNRGRSNGIILFFSDGLINKGDFFDGVEGFIPRFPVHTFTVGGDAYNKVLRTIAGNSPGGTFNPLQVPDKPEQSAPFSQLLDSILIGTGKLEENSGWLSELREDEIKMRNLYLYHTVAGPNADKSSIVNADGSVNNGAIYAGLGSNASLVAHAQGPDISDGDRPNRFRIVFDIERFKGSTLQVVGTEIEGGDWAILGGTGRFSMATGSIRKKMQESRGDGNVIIRLSINVKIPLTVGV